MSAIARQVSVRLRPGPRLSGSSDLGDRQARTEERDRPENSCKNAAQFPTGIFESTGLGDATADVIMSVDAFLFTPDERPALAELARVLRPGGRLAMTSWDYDGRPRNRPPQVADHRPLAEAAGLRVLAYEETDDWYRRCSAFADFLLEHADEAAAEAGMPVADLRQAFQDMRDSLELMTRRFLMIAEKTG